MLSVIKKIIIVLLQSKITRRYLLFYSSKTDSKCYFLTWGSIFLIDTQFTS